MSFWHQSNPLITISFQKVKPDNHVTEGMDSDFLSCDLAAVKGNLRLEVIYETPFWTM